MQKIIAIALNTFRESIRDRIFYSLLAFAFLMLGFSMILGNLTIGDDIKIIKDFGLGAISLFGTLIAISSESGWSIKRWKNGLSM